MSKGQKSKNITMADVAARAGVSIATVSYVLSGVKSRVPISEETRKRVLQAAQACGYHPNASARALSTNRTGHLGFLLSDTSENGWANTFYALWLAAVERACRERDYGLCIMLYNLSNVDTFVFPPRVGQRAVDGVLVTGYVEAAVVERFREFGMPCVCLGDNLEVAEVVPTVGADPVTSVMTAVRYGARLGHRRIWCHTEPSRRGREVIDIVRASIAEDLLAAECEVSPIDYALPTGHRASEILAEQWLDLPEHERPTLIISNEPVLLALIRAFRRRGVACPRDISLISGCDTMLCDLSDPPLTSLRMDHLALGRMAVDLLVEHIEADTLPTPSESRADCPWELVIRDSCRAQSASAPS